MHPCQRHVGFARILGNLTLETLTEVSRGLLKGGGQASFPSGGRGLTIEFGGFCAETPQRPVWDITVPGT